MATSAAGPPPTPTSLLGLPASWLLQLARTSALDNDRTTLLALFRTCTFFRDAVAQRRPSELSFTVPIAAERFQDEVNRLCTLARRSRNIALVVRGPTDQRRNPAPWNETEPHITHLLVCAMARLGGEQPLAGVKRIVLRNLEVTAPVPAWVRVLCPNLECLDALVCTFAAQPERVSTSPAGMSLAAPAMCSRLQRLAWISMADLRQENPPPLDLVRRQLTALPSLTHLHADTWDFTAMDQGGGSAISTSVTRLALSRHGQPTMPQRLATIFPALRELKLASGRVGDAELDGLLRHLGHLDVSFNGFDLTQSFAHRAWPWPHLTTRNLDVDSFARLPLHGIVSCSVDMDVQPSADAQAVARVAEAVRRWGGLGLTDGLKVDGESCDEVVTTLGPLLAALPEGQRRHLTLCELGVGAVTPQFLQRLGAALPPCVERLSLGTSISFSWQPAPDAWGALLPSLPATVERVDLLTVSASEQQLVDMCGAATRRVTVSVSLWSRPEAQGDVLAAVRARLATFGGERAHLVTLVAA